jgi:hypothetical protein
VAIEQLWRFLTERRLEALAHLAQLCVCLGLAPSFVADGLLFVIVGRSIRRRARNSLGGYQQGEQILWFYQATLECEKQERGCARGYERYITGLRTNAVSEVVSQL